MRPLLWKEMRDLRPWMIGSGALLVVLALLCLNRQFEEDFLEAYPVLMPFLAMMAAIALGAGQMSRERSSRTLDFLLARPIAPSAIVWTKFLAGSTALALLLAAMASLCYIDPGFRHPINLNLEYRQAVGFPVLVAAEFPRLWCLYALALGLSTLVNRTAKAVVAGFVSLLALGLLLEIYTQLFPFSKVAAWQPFGREFFKSIRLLHDPAVFFWTGSTQCAAAMLLILAAAFLFRRSPGWSLSNRWMILGAAALAGMAVLSIYAAGNRLPVLRPSGSIELPVDTFYHPAALAAGGGMVAVAEGHNLHLLDFADPTKPRKVADEWMPLWTTTDVAVSGSRVYMLGIRKSLPEDERQIAIAGVTPAGSVQFAEPISLTANDRLLGLRHAHIAAGLNQATLALAGHFVYVGVFRRGQCLVEVYDLSPDASRTEAAAALAIDQAKVKLGDNVFGPTSMGMLLQGQYLYVTSPFALTTIDIRDPGKPVVASRTEYRAPVPIMQGGQRGLLSDGRLLLESEGQLESWKVYDLTEPAHPAPRGHVPMPGNRMGEFGPFFLTWQQGLLEFRAANGGLQALRYLSDGRTPFLSTTRFAAADGYVYMLKGAEMKSFVSAYRVNR